MGESCNLKSGKHGCEACICRTNKTLRVLSMPTQTSHDLVSIRLRVISSMRCAYLTGGHAESGMHPGIPVKRRPRRPPSSPAGLLRSGVRSCCPAFHPRCIKSALCLGSSGFRSPTPALHFSSFSSARRLNALVESLDDLGNHGTRTKLGVAIQSQYEF